MSDVDTFHDTMQEAMEERRRRKAEGTGAYVVRIDPSGHGGYRVRSIPTELFVDEIAESITTFGGPRNLTAA